MRPGWDSYPMGPSSSPRQAATPNAAHSPSGDPTYTRREVIAAAAAPVAALALPGTRRDSTVWLLGMRHAPSWPRYALVSVLEEDRRTVSSPPWDKFLEYVMVTRRPDGEVVSVAVHVRPWWVDTETGERKVWTADGLRMGPEEKYAQTSSWDETRSMAIRQAHVALQAHMDEWGKGGGR